MINYTIFFIKNLLVYCNIGTMPQLLTMPRSLSDSGLSTKPFFFLPVYELGCEIGSVRIEYFDTLVLLAYYVYCILIM